MHLSFNPLHLYEKSETADCWLTVNWSSQGHCDATTGDCDEQ